ncbi:TIM barrel protein [Microbispora sp. ATCC PTA-5024]|uniref:TIM barrel protein n=1 Tax=Microbispora sp. ATCC PTA-5024 TaxID=316330 RepID=UPI0003DDB16D|nr:TIM barrel protein [Microbispora sp. ATCC PTA-5024]ETK32673.1 hypothetical protein MPTA5024_28600 [Microbispora sp. ATCC PTA-5024]
MSRDPAGPSGRPARAVRIASAPVSFGVYLAGRAAIGPDEMLAAMREAGYDGTDSGPLGYLGTGPGLARRLARHGLGLAGGWVDLRYGDPGGFAEDVVALEAALDVFASVPVDDPRFAPRPTLACPDNPERYARPGMPADRRLRVPDEEWPAFAARVREAAARCRDRGLEPAFHHHLGTDVETPEEIERLLDLTDVSLCLDTGHLWLAGGDPVRALRDWAPRIRQVHVKDAARDTLARVRTAGGDLAELVRRGGFRPLGSGDLNVSAIAAELRRTGYEGWIVVEQDVVAPEPDPPGAGGAAGRPGTAAGAAGFPWSRPDGPAGPYAAVLARAVGDQRDNLAVLDAALRSAGL